MQISITFDPQKDSDISAVHSLLEKLYGEKKLSCPAKITPPPAEIKIENDHVEVQKGPVVMHVDTPEEAKEQIEIAPETLRTATQAKIVAGFRNEVAALLKSLGAANVSSIKKEQWSEYLEKLDKIGTK